MASEDIAFKVEVPTDGGKSLSDLKKEFKELQKELSQTNVGTKEYQKTLEKLGAVKDDIGDLRDTINALNPEGKVAAFAKVGSTIASGFAAAQGAAALFGAESEDLQKTMMKVQAAMALAEGIKGIAGAADAMKVLNAVMKSNPIFLIVGAIVAVGAALFALKDKVAFIGKAFEVVGDIIGWVMDKVTEFTDAIGLSNSALSKQGEVLTASINSATEALNKQTQAFDDQIAIAKASGKSTIDLEIAKQKAIIETNKALVEQTIAYVRNGGELDKERAKLLTGQLESIKKATVQIDIIEATANTKRLEDYKKHSDEKAALQKKADEDFLAQQQKIREQLAKYDEEDAASAAKKAEAEEALVLLRMENSLRVSEYNKQKAQEEADYKIEQDKKHTDAVNANTNASLQIAKISIDSQAQLVNLFYDLKRSRLEKGSAEELKAAKRQFQINKALAIQSAIISGIQGVVNALSAQSVIPEPFGTILKVATAVGVGIAAAVNIAKISQSQFNEGGGGGGSVSADVGGMTAQAPAIPQPNNTATTISDDGKVTPKTLPTQKVVVVETDIKNANDRVANIEETAKI